MHAGKATAENGGTRHRWRMAAWTVAALILLLPLVAMQLTDQVSWDAADFAVFGLMLLAAGGAFEAAAGTTGNTAYRAAIGVALATAFLLVWMNLAVGIIGTEDDPANMLFGGVLAVGVGGAAITRLRPAAMARVLVATALAQAAVAMIALVAGFGAMGRTWPAGILILTGFFATLWLMSACLFRKAARQQASATTAPQLPRYCGPEPR